MIVSIVTWFVLAYYWTKQKERIDELTEELNFLKMDMVNTTTFYRDYSQRAPFHDEFYGKDSDGKRITPPEIDEDEENTFNCTTYCYSQHRFSASTVDKA